MLPRSMPRSNSLYATGLFQNVKISHDGDAVFVSVVENPTLVRVAFEGNHKIKDADLKKDLQSKESGPLWRAFVQSDVERIGALYRLRGYFETRVVPKTIKLKDDRVNLVFEIKENEKLAVRQIVFVGNSRFSAQQAHRRDQDRRHQSLELCARQRQL